MLDIDSFTSHQLRHSCATTMLRNHVDSALVAKQLGHRGLQYIPTYAEIDLEQRREAVATIS